MWRRLLALGWLPTLLVCLAVLATGAMYVGNDLADKNAVSARPKHDKCELDKVLEAYPAKLPVLKLAVARIVGMDFKLVPRSPGKGVKSSAYKAKHSFVWVGGLIQKWACKVC